MKSKQATIALGALSLALLSGCNTTPAPTATGAAAQPWIQSREVGELLVLDEVDVPPKIVHRVEPVFPADIRRASGGGQIAMRAVVLEDGAVAQVRTRMTSHWDFQVPALGALRQWQFEPAIKDGKPIAVSIEVVFEVSPP